MKDRIFKIVLISIVIFIVINNFIFLPGNVLSWDVFGYYLYLPFRFIYNDLGLSDISVLDGIIEKYNNTGVLYQVLDMPGGDHVMKYSMGLSFFYAPFFFIGHLVAIVFNYPADGFSLPYQYSILIGGIIYSIIGIWILSKALLRFFSGKTAAIVLFLIVFSTNYIIHITMYGQNAMSHNFLFMTYALIIWLSILWHESYKLKYMIFLAITCGITILSRPSEVVCLIIPALWGISNKNFVTERLKLFYKYKKQIAVFIIILMAFGSFQMIYWKIHTGKFLFNSYGGNAGEGLELFRPFISDVLFSFRKGWLIYTPVMIFAIAGFYFLFRKNRSVFYALIVYFIVNIYIVSAWTCWWYAQSFSQRALIPSYPVMAVGLGYFITWLDKRLVLKIAGYVLIAGCLLLNIFQSIQYHSGIIDGDRMTREYYFRVFGKMEANEEDKKLLLVKRSFDGIEIFKNENEYNSKLLVKMDFEEPVKNDTTVYYSGKYSFKLDSSTVNSPFIGSPYYVITDRDYAWIKVTAYVYPIKDPVNEPFSLIVNFDHNGYAYKYYKYDSENMKLEINKWNEIVFWYLTPEVRTEKDSLKVHFMHRGKAPVFIDDLRVDVFEKK